MRRVVIVGRGAVTPLGHDPIAFEQALTAGRSAITQIGPFARRVDVSVAAPVTGFVPEQHFDSRRLTQLDRCSQFALVAARQALAEAGLAAADYDGGTRAAAVLGTAIGGIGTTDEGAERLYAAGKDRAHPLTIPRLMPSAAASQVSMECGIRGPVFGVTSACASANHALGLAFQLVRSGAFDLALAGGTEACLTYLSFKAWEALRVCDPETCRPFSLGRKGMVLGEGAALFALVPLELAQARGLPLLAELVGFGMSADAGDIVAPSVDGMAAAIRAALLDASLAPEDIDYVNAHGTGTPVNDPAETRALHTVFGEHARRLSISSTKSMHGHALGASGALELLATLYALRTGIIPPTLNYLGPDPDCDLDYTPNTPREREVRVALSNSFAFGGLNAVLALRRCD